MRTVISFSGDTRGQGRAAGNVGVPVLWGLGGGSGAGDSFHSPVLFRPGAVESYASARPGICSKVVIFRLVLVDFVAGRQGLRETKDSYGVIYSRTINKTYCPQVSLGAVSLNPGMSLPFTFPQHVQHTGTC